MASRPFGAAWIAKYRSAVLTVPNVGAREETHLLINPARRAQVASS
ncbi:MAG: hypothetical protein AAGA68_15390 [Pseudomonadota bacterium]